MARNAAPEWGVKKMYVESTYSTMGRKWGALIICITKLTNVDTNKDI